MINNDWISSLLNVTEVPEVWEGNKVVLYNNKNTLINGIPIKINFRKMAVEDYFHYVAIGTTILSSMAVVLLLFAIPTIYLKAERERLYAITKSASFKVRNSKSLKNILKGSIEMG